MKKTLVDSLESATPLFDATRPVRVYRNLNSKCYSVQQDGIVRFHAKQLAIRNFRTIVNNTARMRVLREKRKNVHAFIEGIIYDIGDRVLYSEVDFIQKNGLEFRCYTAFFGYNPYESGEWRAYILGRGTFSNVVIRDGASVVLRGNFPPRGLFIN